MHNKELAEIPIQNFLSSQGIVVVWCTNSSGHVKSILEEIFPSWGITYLAKWFWLKVNYFSLIYHIKLTNLINITGYSKWSTGL